MPNYHAPKTRELMAARNRSALKQLQDCVALLRVIYHEADNAGQIVDDRVDPALRVLEEIASGSLPLSTARVQIAQTGIFRPARDSTLRRAPPLAWGLFWAVRRVSELLRIFTGGWSGWNAPLRGRGSYGTRRLVVAWRDSVRRLVVRSLVQNGQPVAAVDQRLASAILAARDPSLVRVAD